MHLQTILIMVAVMFEKCDCRRCTLKHIAQDIIFNCSYQGCRSIPKHIPVNTTVLDLSGNIIPLLRNKTFSYLVYLRSLQLSSSSVTQLDSDVFYGLNSLTSLDLSANFLDFTSFSESLFKPIRNLDYLDLSGNNAEFSELYPDKSLSVLTKLTNLRINGIRNGVFGDGFSKLINLKTIEFVPCEMTCLKNETFGAFEKLQIESMTLECQINKIEIGAFVPVKQIKNLDMTNNNIRLTHIIPSLVAFKDQTMEVLNLAENYKARTGTEILTQDHFKILGDICVRSLNMDRNQISIMRTGSIRIMKHKNCLESWSLAKNVIYGELGLALEFFHLTVLKSLYLYDQRPIAKPNRLQLIRRHNKDVSVNCSEPNAHCKQKLTQLKRPFAVHFPLPPNLEELYAYNIVGKPGPLLNITIIFGHKLRVFDLNWILLTACEGAVAGIDNLEVFGMSGFNCSRLNVNLLSPFKRLKKLEAVSCNLGIGLRSDTEGVFLKGLTHLEEVDFSKNELTNIENLFQSQRTSLSSVNLAYNEMTEFPFSLTEFKNLKFIDLRYNKIRYLEQKATNELDQLNKRVGLKLRLLLDQNRFDCDCNALHFIEWLSKTNVSLDNQGNYTCSYVDGSTKSTNIVFANLKEFQTYCISKLWLVFSICLSALFVLVLVGAIIGYKYRITLQYWCISFRRKYRHYMKMEGDTKNYKYSAFVAYHNSDYQWVCGPLCSFLEKERGLSLCLHHRDFVVGSLIADNIIEAVTQSKKIILIVSRNFLESSWCEYELNMARMQMFQENRDMLIIVLLNDIKTKEMPKSLLRIWNQVTCLETTSSDLSCTNSLFWKRLYEAVML